MRVLFIPVSAPRGMGEYARCIALAGAISHRWPEAEIHFALSRMAPYAAETPFPATLLPSSPTFHPAEIIALIGSFRPDVVVFDNAGRTAQLRAAKASGARVVYVSSRPRQRRRGFRLRWMRLLDEHWIAYPEFIAGPLAKLEQIKLRLVGKPTVRYLDTVMPRVDEAAAGALLKRVDVTAAHYVLAVPGGGTGHPGAESTPMIIAAAAGRLAARGVPTVFVGATSDPAQANQHENLRWVPRLPPAELSALLRHARMVISNGGDTLLQAVACQLPCVAVAIAADQKRRIKRCVDAGLIRTAAPNAAEIESVSHALLADETAQAALKARARDFPLVNGLDTALDAIGALVAGRK